MGAKNTHFLQKYVNQRFQTVKKCSIFSTKGKNNTN